MRTNSVSRDSLTTYLSTGRGTAKQRRLAELRLQYSEIAALRSTFVAALQGHDRICPIILPTQVTGRWSYINPPLSNFPKKCINPECPKGLHRKTAACWSLRDCITPDPETFWIEHDLDAVEHRIYSLILKWDERLEALRDGEDIHTPVTCALFSLPCPVDRINPHESAVDAQWRELVSWRGKDDPRRTISKNFTYGGQYFYVRALRYKERVRKPYRSHAGLWYNPAFVHTIPNLQSYKVLDASGALVTPDFEALAVRFVESNVDIQWRKALLMEHYRKQKYARNLYGGIRRAWFQNQDAAKDLFNSVVQGTVASYINESAILLQEEFPSSYIIHNQHDSLKWAFFYDSEDEEKRKLQEEETLERCKQLCQRSVLVEGSGIPITATFKLVRARADIREEDREER